MWTNVDNGMVDFPFLCIHLFGQYLWYALCDCGLLKSTESEISSDEMSSETKVSYNEFLQQYKELTEWLGHIRLMVRQQAACRSENYLTHVSTFQHFYLCF